MISVRVTAAHASRMYGRAPLFLSKGRLMMTQGIVKWLGRNAHFGFARAHGAKDDLFFHHSELSDGDFKRIEIGDRIEFEVVPAKDDRQKAVKVRVLADDSATIKYGAA